MIDLMGNQYLQREGTENSETLHILVFNDSWQSPWIQQYQHHLRTS